MVWFYLLSVLASDMWEMLCPLQDSAPLGVGFWLVMLLGVCLLQTILPVFVFFCYQQEFYKLKSLLLPKPLILTSEHLEFVVRACGFLAPVRIIQALNL